MIPKYNHAEAFKLMSYKCEVCGYEEKIWNSRDGVTPFVVKCPKCEKGESRHINWQSDQYSPEFVPERGERVFVDMPESMKIVFARRRANQAPYYYLKKHGMSREELTQSILEDMREGEPFVIIMP